MSAVTVIGAGYVGLVTSACLAELGHKVTCLESDSGRVASLWTGRLPITEPGLAEIWSRNYQKRLLAATDNPREALARSEFVFVAVGTPEAPDGSADLTYLDAAINMVVNHADGRPVICVKSTVPPGTCSAIEYSLRRQDVELQSRWRVVSNPEFLSQGSAVKDFMNPDRILVGSSDRRTAEKVASLYSCLKSRILFMDPTAAELAKYASNSFLALKISFINEIAQVSESLGIDVEQVSKAIGLDGRIGPRFLHAGIGWGGSCFPKDTAALARVMEKAGIEPRVIYAARAVNAGQIDHIVSRLARLVPPDAGERICVFGLTFKPGTDDIRGSQSISLIRRLLKRGYKVTACDPATSHLPPELHHEVVVSEQPAEALAGASAAILATPWPEFLALDYRSLGGQMKERVLVDAHRALDPDELRAAGFTYYRPGDGLSSFDIYARPENQAPDSARLNGSAHARRRPTRDLTAPDMPRPSTLRGWA